MSEQEDEADELRCISFKAAKNFNYCPLCAEELTHEKAKLKYGGAKVRTICPEHGELVVK